MLSRKKISKDTVVKHAIRLPIEKSIISDTPSMKLCSPSFVISTPLGFPVDPEVYNI